MQATISYFTSPSNRVPPTPVAKPKAAPVSPLPLKATEPQIPELIKPKDMMKPPSKQVASTTLLPEQETNDVATSTASAEKSTPLQKNGQPTRKPNGLPALPQDPRPKKRPRPPPRPNPAASLFIPAKKVCLPCSSLPTPLDAITEATARR